MKKEYETRTYRINPYQLRILNHIKNFPQKRLHYLVGQQSKTNRNLSLSEMKMLIRKGIRNYCKGLNIHFRKGDENKLIKYFCVFETTKTFFHSQHENIKVDEEIEMGVHFHLFISSPDNYPWVSFPSLFHTIFTELTHLPQNRRCISKFDYNRLIDVDENFILYHTKQFMYHFSTEMVMTNVRIKKPIQTTLK